MTGKKPTAETGLIDTNLLVYFADAADRKRHGKAVEFFWGVSKKPGYYVISTQNLREFASVMIKKKRMPKETLLDYLSLFVSSFPLVLQDNIRDIVAASAISLEEKTPFWDSLLFSTMARHGIKLIYSENVRDFRKLNLRVKNPVG